MESGIVKFFNVAKRFGFIKLEDGTEIFFHFNDGEFIIDGPDKPIFSGKAKIVIQGKIRSLKDPEREDELMFNRRMGSKGPVASPWGYKSHFDRATNTIKSRVKYRVIIRYDTIGSKELQDKKVVWEGLDLNDPELNKVWNLKYDMANFSCGDFSSEKWFEKQVKENWIRCSDPRTI